MKRLLIGVLAVSLANAFQVNGKSDQKDVFGRTYVSYVQEKLQPQMKYDVIGTNPHSVNIMSVMEKNIDGNGAIGDIYLPSKQRATQSNIHYQYVSGSNLENKIGSQPLVKEVIEEKYEKTNDRPDQNGYTEQISRQIVVDNKNPIYRPLLVNNHVAVAKGLGSTISKSDVLTQNVIKRKPMNFGIYNVQKQEHLQRINGDGLGSQYHSTLTTDNYGPIQLSQNKPLAYVDRTVNKKLYYPLSQFETDNDLKIQQSEITEINQGSPIINENKLYVYKQRNVEGEDTGRPLEEYYLNKKVNFVGDKSQDNDDRIKGLNRKLLIEFIAQSVNKFEITLEELQMAGAYFENVNCQQCFDHEIFRSLKSNQDEPAVVKGDGSVKNILQIHAEELNGIKREPITSEKIEKFAKYGGVKNKYVENDVVQVQNEIKNFREQTYKNELNDVNEKKAPLRESSYIPSNYNSIIEKSPQLETSHYVERNRYDFPFLEYPKRDQTLVNEDNIKVLNQPIVKDHDYSRIVSNVYQHEKTVEPRGADSVVQDWKYRSVLKPEMGDEYTKTVKKTFYVNNDVNDVNRIGSVGRSLLRDYSTDLSQAQNVAFKLITFDKYNVLPSEFKENLMNLLETIKWKWNILHQLISLLLKYDRSHCFVHSGQLKDLLLNTNYGVVNTFPAHNTGMYLKRFPCRIGTEIRSACEVCQCKYNGVSVCRTFCKY